MGLPEGPDGCCMAPHGAYVSPHCNQMITRPRPKGSPGVLGNHPENRAFLTNLMPVGPLRLLRGWPPVSLTLALNKSDGASSGNPLRWTTKASLLSVLGQGQPPGHAISLELPAGEETLHARSHADTCSCRGWEGVNGRAARARRIACSPSDARWAAGKTGSQGPPRQHTPSRRR